MFAQIAKKVGGYLWDDDTDNMTAAPVVFIEETHMEATRSSPCSVLALCNNESIASGNDEI